MVMGDRVLRQVTIRSLVGESRQWTVEEKCVG